MSKMVELNLSPDERTLRQFGYIALGGFGLLAAAAWYEAFVFAFGLGAARATVAIILAGLAALSLLFSVTAPKANWPIYVGLTLVSYPIGFVLSYLIMGALYFGLIAPIALFFRVIGRDPMARSYDRSAKSYWTKARPARPRDDYFRQY